MSERSTGVGVANWLVSKTSGFLDSRLSRRSFISRATLAGTAVAATGCSVVTQQGAPYTRITDCPPGSLCRDGYTEFCCVINNGVNACPPNTVSAGWWRADGSPYCASGTRYYIDCNETCCGPQRGDGFCAGCHPCQCGAGCNTRKVHCNYFRYGQCHQLLAHVGPIACRMVTCTPPYQLNMGCSPSGAVDNSTAGHFTDCSKYKPPPPPMPALAAVMPGLNGATVAAPGSPAVFARFEDTGVYFRRFDGASWTDWAGIGGIATSGGSAVPLGSGQMMMLVRLADFALWQWRYDGSDWTPTKLGGVLNSDPVAVVHNGEIFVFARASNRAYVWLRYAAGAWSPFANLFGIASSTPVAVSTGSRLFMFGRLADNAMWYTSWNGSAWSPAESLGGVISSDPGAAVVGGNVVLFGRGSDRALWFRRFDGSSWSAWASLGGDIVSDPVAATVGSDLFVFGRTARFELAHRHTQDGITWDPWTVIGPPIMSDPATAVDGATLHVFASFAKTQLGHLAFNGSAWGAWEDLGGELSLVRGR